jgi:transaldolase
MPIFLDTSIIKEIACFHAMGIIRGVTTNPTIMLKDGLTGGMKGIEQRSKEIAKLIAPLPVSVEVIATERKMVIQQAQMFASWAENINVKVTIHGPNGELENLEIIHELETRYDIRVNVTAMMNAQQCLLAALSGATYVSLFGGRINNMGYDSCIEIQKLRKVIDRFGLSSKIIVASTREVFNVIEWLEAGAHIVTVLPDLLRTMIVHPYSKETVQMFLNDGARVEAQLNYNIFQLEVR